MSNKDVEYAEKLYQRLIQDVDERKLHQRGSRKPRGSEILDVLSVNLEINKNSIEHHTEEYEQSSSQPYRLVLRRGQEFRLTLHLDREFQPAKDAVLLDFSFGARPSAEKLTRRVVDVQDEVAELTWRWGAKVAAIDGTRLIVTVKSAGNCPVGEWKLEIQTGKRKEEGRVGQTFPSYSLPGFIFILFNAWSVDDAVHLESEEEREEYVLRDHGALWQGAKRGQYAACPWNFGQFEDVALFAALLSLRQGQYLSDSERADPVLVSRRLTASVVDNILAGRWQEPYDDGTKPWEWTGSAAILEEYINNPQQPVKYGQCWVFSGVLVTLCRALGLPCRSVTCIRSAHDTDKTLTIDHVYIKDPVSGTFEEESGGDSVWNFHVWNELWTQRTDLPPGFDGWQAIDATPQEMSQGRYQCGPMSVEAIRRGEVGQAYDGWFIFGEVNADVVRWYYTRDPDAPEGRRLIKAYTDTTDVGRAVVTSSLADPLKAADVTEAYKAAEGSEGERSQLRHAVREGVRRERADIIDLYHSDTLKDDVEFKLCDLETVKFGSPISSQLSIKNKAKSERKVHIQMDLLILRYTGVTHRKVMTGSEEINLDPGQSQSFSLEAAGVDYGHLLGEHSSMCVEAVAVVEGTDQIFAHRDIFLIQKPPVYIEYSGFFREMAGMASAYVEHSVVPRKAGKRSLLALFNSEQMSNLRGTHPLTILP